MKRKTLLILMLFTGYTCFLNAQEVINIFQGVIPNSKENSIAESFERGMFRNVTSPTLEIYLPEKEVATGAAVVVCPGGGYSVVVYQGEGISTAKRFVKNGIAAFVLKYRLPGDETMTDKTIGPLQDAQQAIKVVRENAEKWGVKPDKIGIIGFSAGGHLASTAATHFSEALIENTNNTSLRPDFQILVYPVISMKEKLTHPDSRRKLLGENPTQDLVDLYSGELQVNENTPPAYLTHATDDKLVDVDNSINYYEALRHHNVPVEMHIYRKGGHGFIFGRNDWIEPVIKWMADSGIIEKQQ
ncbi:MAG: alpha/beta hydrolase [Prolixibacteraceae bacterium]|nr:alpha/beta hydrolase [Prolixibacteraceae bacterium]